MITVVSGFPRSGTSMMMRCLIDGGIKPIWDKQREQKMRGQSTQDYEINKHGFYEVGSEKFIRIGYTAELPHDVCIKIQAWGLPILSPGKCYKIILMRRDPDAIRDSFIAAFSERSFNNQFPDWPTHYWTLLDNVRGIMQQRRDVELLELHYDDVLADPIGSMRRVSAMGVPIDVDASIQTVEPGLKRHG